MTIKDSILNTNHSVIMAWIGNTFFSGASIIETLVHEINTLTIIGWVITSFFAVVVSIYRIKQIKAETTKADAITDRINLLDSLLKATKNSNVPVCKLEDCPYRILLEKINVGQELLENTNEL